MLHVHVRADPFRHPAGGCFELVLGWLLADVLSVSCSLPGIFRYNTSNVPEEELGGDPPRWQTALLVASLTLLHGLGVIIVTAILATVSPDMISLWAQVLGVMAALLAAVQYFPRSGLHII